MTDVGIKGTEQLRLAKLGVLEFFSGNIALMAADNMVFDAVDMIGVMPTFEKAREMMDAYGPVVAKHMAEQFNVKLLMTWPNPAQVIYCKPEIGGVADIKGKKVRVSTTGASDFVSAVGGIPVTIQWAEVIPAAQRGALDCGITGTLSGNTGKWWEVFDYHHPITLTWGMWFHAVNLDTWNRLDPSVQGVLRREVRRAGRDAVGGRVRGNPGRHQLQHRRGTVQVRCPGEHDPGAGHRRGPGAAQRPGGGRTSSRRGRRPAGRPAWRNGTPRPERCLASPPRRTSVRAEQDGSGGEALAPPLRSVRSPDPNPMDYLIRQADRLSTAAVWVAGATLIGMSLLVCGDVVARWYFDASLAGTDEIGGYSRRNHQRLGFLLTHCSAGRTSASTACPGSCPTACGPSSTSSACSPWEPSWP